MVIEFNGSNMIQSGVLYFYSNYSSKCSIYIDAINKAFSKIDTNVLRINLTKFYELKVKYSIKRVPELIIIKNSNVISRISGVVDSYTLDKWLKANI